MSENKMTPIIGRYLMNDLVILVFCPVYCPLLLLYVIILIVNTFLVYPFFVNIFSGLKACFNR